MYFLRDAAEIEHLAIVPTSGEQLHRYCDDVDRLVWSKFSYVNQSIPASDANTAVCALCR